MHQQSISISPPTVVFIDHIDGDLQIKGWERPEALIRCDNQADLSITNENEALHINCRDNCSICLPFAADIHIGEVQGDSWFKGLEKRLQIEHVHGSVVLQHTPELQLKTVEGELTADKISGNMIIDQAHGDVFINHLEKGCAIQKVSGALHLYDIKGDIYASTEGDAYLRQKHPTQASCQIISSGDIHCQLPKGIHARVSLISEANVIQIQLLNENDIYESREKQLTLGEGKADFRLSANGKIFFSCRDYNWEKSAGFEAGFDFDFQNISESFIGEMEAQFSKQMAVLNEHMEKLTETLNTMPLPDREIERMVERARQSSVTAAQRAQEKMARAQRKLEQKLAAAKRKSDSRAGRYSQDHAGFHFQWDFKPKPASPVDEEISQDERLVILRMLEEKKISLEEADNLLRALEGE